MTNVGLIDRIARIALGVLLISYAIPFGFPRTGWNWIGWIGVVPLLTAAIEVCPVYSLLGINTCGTRQRR